MDEPNSNLQEENPSTTMFPLLKPKIEVVSDTEDEVELNFQMDCDNQLDFLQTKIKVEEDAVKKEVVAVKVEEDEEFADDDCQSDNPKQLGTSNMDVSWGGPSLLSPTTLIPKIKTEGQKKSKIGLKVQVDLPGYVARGRLPTSPPKRIKGPSEIGISKARPVDSQPLFRCDHCNYESKNKEKFKYHKVKHDLKNKSVPCNEHKFCKVFVTEDSLKIHMSTEPNGDVNKQHISSSTSSTRGSTSSTMSSTSSTMGSSHAQNQVNGALAKPIRLESTLRNRLDKNATTRMKNKLSLIFKDFEPLFKCKHCKYTCKDKEKYQLHQAKHDPNMTIMKCDKCSKLFLSQGSLTLHMLTHIVADVEEEPIKPSYACHICNKKYISRRDLKQHLLSVHNTCILPEEVYKFEDNLTFFS